MSKHIDENIYTQELATKAKKTSALSRTLCTKTKNRVLETLANLIVQNQDYIMAENKKDLDKGVENKLTTAMLDRLALSEKTIGELAKSVREIVQLPDPVGQTTGFRKLENGLSIGQVNAPLGVVLVIYESRPNVTIDVAALCIKSGNIAILRGGSEAFFSNQALYKMLVKACEINQLPALALFVEHTERSFINLLLKRNDLIDIVVPRGGYGLIRNVSENSTIPVIKHDAGICHIYVCADAPQKMVTSVILNAKTQRPGTCNAVETILVDAAYPHSADLIQKLLEHHVVIKGCEKSQKLNSAVQAASENDYATEWLDLIINFRIVQSIDEAVAHIEQFGSGHSEAILTNNYALINTFKEHIDSAAIFINCSTRFHDGGQFGLGAEVGISTQKLHVRGPMGLEHLTCKKYLVYGQGQVRE